MSSRGSTSYGGEYSKRHGQVEVRAFLEKIGWSEVDEDTPRRQREAHSGQGRADPFARLGNRLIGQANDQESRQACGDLHLNFDRNCFDPGETRNCERRRGSSSWRFRHDTITTACACYGKSAVRWRRCGAGRRDPRGSRTPWNPDRSLRRADCRASQSEKLNPDHAKRARVSAYRRLNDRGTGNADARVALAATNGRMLRSCRQKQGEGS